MGIFKRISDIISANFNDLLEAFRCTLSANSRGVTFSRCSTSRASRWPSTWQLLRKFGVNIQVAAFSPATERVWTADQGGLLRLWDTKTGEVMQGVWLYDTANWKGRQVPGSTAIQPRDISPDLTKVAVLGKTLMVWNVDNLQEVQDFQDPVRTPFAHGVLDAP